MVPVTHCITVIVDLILFVDLIYHVWLRLALVVAGYGYRLYG